MAGRNEVMAFRAWTKSPGGDKLRKCSAAELRHLLSVGWHEVGRNQTADQVMIRLERPVTAAPVVHARRREDTGEGGGGGSRRH